MKLATTTDDLFLYCTNYTERIKHVIEAGFRYIDLGMYDIKDDDELLSSDNWRENAERIGEYAKNNGALFVQAHSPGGNPLTEDEASERLIDATIRSIEICGILKIPNIVVHAGMLPGIDKKEYFERNRTFFRKLFPAMEKNNVNVLCENSTKANMRDMYFTNSGEDMESFIQYVNHPLFHGCWDTGHANIEGSQYSQILALGKDLYALHINDNRGMQDEHLIPYFGTVNMDEIMHALIDCGYKGYFTFEGSSTLRTEKSWFGDRRSFDGDNRLVQPQLFMQKQLLKLMYDIGVYILKKYDCYEE